MMLNIIGKSTIHPILFYTGKISGYATWILLISSLVFKTPASNQPIELIKLLSILIATAGLAIAIISLFNLGRSTRLGLPEENTEFKKNGLYKLSRNPMYVGFDLLTLSSIFFLGNFVIGLLGLYSIIIYHFIILGEENYLDNKFVYYSEYKRSTRRYI